jgi:small-conductance mechanosensitive channel
MPSSQEILDESPARIESVEYGFVKNMGNYQSERLTVTMTVNAHDDPNDVLHAARQWVAEHLSISEPEADQLRDKFTYTQRELTRMERLVAEQRQRYDKFRKALDTLGLSVPSEIEDLPF